MSFLVSLDALVLGLFERVTSWIQSKTSWDTFKVAKLFVGLFIIVAIISAWYTPWRVALDVMFLLLLVIEIKSGKAGASYDGEGYRHNPYGAAPARVLVRALWLVITCIGFMTLENPPKSLTGIAYTESAIHTVRMFVVLCILYLSACTPYPRASQVRRHLFSD